MASRQPSGGIPGHPACYVGRRRADIPVLFVFLPVSYFYLL
jgi:hypothetical protein